MRSWRKKMAPVFENSSAVRKILLIYFKVVNWEHFQVSGVSIEKFIFEEFFDKQGFVYMITNRPDCTLRIFDIRERNLKSTLINLSQTKKSD